jgi:choline dehydrogenase
VTGVAESANEEFDAVVVGAGSSGGVVASRLSESGACRVLLLEAGPDFPEEERLLPLFAASGSSNWLPLGIPEYDWHLWDAPQPNGRRVRLPRGKLVGGSSMANGTIAVRGAPFDYDRWARLGNTGWGWENLLPLFVRIESDADFGSRPYHGSDGPIYIKRYREQAWSPIHHAFVEGCTELGLLATPDLNAPEANDANVGPWPHNRRNQVRLGTLVTYIREARGRPRFVVRGNAHVDRVILDGTAARGVVYLDVETRGLRTIFADLVVLAAGAYGTPAILQRSGIGPEAILRPLGIDAIADLPVGEHLLDHAKCFFTIAAPKLAHMDGPMMTVNCRAPADSNGEPPWQAFAVPIDEVEGSAGIAICLNRQDSQGSVQIPDSNPESDPIINHRYATVESDIARFAEAFDFCRALLGTRAFTRAKAREAIPGQNVRDALATNVETSFHPVGTCKMGPDGDETAVVDHRLMLRGLTNLMVADASVFPDHIMNNPNLTCFVIGERAAEIAAEELGIAAPANCGVSDAL